MNKKIQAVFIGLLIGILDKEDQEKLPLLGKFYQLSRDRTKLVEEFIGLILERGIDWTMGWPCLLLAGLFDHFTNIIKQNQAPDW